MPRVVPSQVVQFITRTIPPPAPLAAAGTMRVNSIGSGGLRGVLDLVALVPDELLVMDDYPSFVAAKAQIEDVLDIWDSNRAAGAKWQEIRWNSTSNPLVVIRSALAKCPDESFASTSELAFITDADLRANLRIDIGAVNRALSNGEWKAATVLAGSAIEAMLLWKLQQRSQAEIDGAVAALVASKTFAKKPPSDLEEWVLFHYIEVAAHLGVIKPDTWTATRLAKDFRNLIHPGRAQRLAQKCNRGTALSCVAALELVVTDLS